MSSGRRFDDFVVFDQDWLDIPIQDYPIGNLAVCHDPQRRLDEVTWAVVIAHADSPPDALGLFWERDDAIQYARSMCGS